MGLIIKKIIFQWARPFAAEKRKQWDFFDLSISIYVTKINFVASRHSKDKTDHAVFVGVVYYL